MKTTSCFMTAVLTSTLLVGCARSPDKVGLTNNRHPGPVVGNAIGVGIGSVVGTTAGIVVGAGEGFGAGMAAPFKNEKQLVRKWRSEKTVDGRTIQVPEEFEVDRHGRPVDTASVQPVSQAK